MWHKAIWKEHPMRLELTRVGLLVELANHYNTRGAFPDGNFCLKIKFSKFDQYTSTYGMQNIWSHSSDIKILNLLLSRQDAHRRNEKFYKIGKRHVYFIYVI